MVKRLLVLTTLACLLTTTLGQQAEQSLTENQLFDLILTNTKYDLRQRPTNGLTQEPVQVLNSVYMYFMGHIDDERLEFQTILMIR